MALSEPPNIKIIKDTDGNVRPETTEEHEKRIKKESEERYEREITEIMTKGDFTRKQAIYIHKMKQDYITQFVQECIK